MSTPQERQRVFQEHFARLKEAGHAPSKVAAALLPILSGANAADVVAAAESSLASSASASSSSSAAPAAASGSSSAAAPSSSSAAPPLPPPVAARPAAGSAPVAAPASTSAAAPAPAAAPVSAAAPAVPANIASLRFDFSGLPGADALSRNRRRGGARGAAAASRDEEEDEDNEDEDNDEEEEEGAGHEELADEEDEENGERLLDIAVSSSPDGGNNGSGDDDGEEEAAAAAGAGSDGSTSSLASALASALSSVMGIPIGGGSGSGSGASSDSASSSPPAAGSSSSSSAAAAAPAGGGGRRAARDNSNGMGAALAAMLGLPPGTVLRVEGLPPIGGGRSAAAAAGAGAGSSSSSSSSGGGSWASRVAADQRSAAEVINGETVADRAEWASDIDINGLSLDRVREIAELAEVAEEPGLLVRFVASTFASVACLGKSFLHAHSKPPSQPQQLQGKPQFALESSSSSSSSLSMGVMPPPLARVASVGDRPPALPGAIGASSASPASSSPPAGQTAGSSNRSGSGRVSAEMRDSSNGTASSGSGGRKRSREEAFGSASNDSSDASGDGSGSAESAAMDVDASSSSSSLSTAPSSSSSLGLPVPSSLTSLIRSLNDSSPTTAPSGASRTASAGAGSGADTLSRNPTSSPYISASSGLPSATPVATFLALPPCPVDVASVLGSYSAIVEASKRLRNEEAVKNALVAAIKKAAATMIAAGPCIGNGGKNSTSKLAAMSSPLSPSSSENPRAVNEESAASSSSSSSASAASSSSSSSSSAAPASASSASPSGPVTSEEQAVTYLLNAFVVLCCCPLFDDPSTHPSLVALTKALEALPQRGIVGGSNGAGLRANGHMPFKVLAHWFATAGEGDDPLALHSLMLRRDDPVALALGAFGHEDNDGDEDDGKGKKPVAGAGSSSASSSSMDVDGSASSSSSSSSSSGMAAATGLRTRDISPLLMKRTLDSVQQYLTVRLYEGGTRAEDISGPLELLGIIYAANSEYGLLHGGKPALEPASFANEVISSEIDLGADYRRWASDRQRSTAAGASSSKGRVFSFCSYPFILDAAAKSLVLTMDAEFQQEQQARRAIMGSMFFGGGGGAEQQPYFYLKVKRDNLLEDACKGIVNLGDKAQLKKPLRVVFEGEEGIDAGGVKREFFTLLTKQLFDPAFGMFTDCGDESSGGSVASRGLLWFNQDSLEPPVNYELVGSLIGLAIYNGVILDVQFPSVVYRKLKGEPVSLKDLDDFKPERARSMKEMLDYKGDDFEDVFCLDFTVTRTSAWGEVVTEDLVPEGSSISVTKANRKSYVHAYLRWLLVDSIKTQWNAFARGFNNVAAGPALDIFRAEELALLVTGSKKLDFAALEKTARYEEPFSPAHRVIKWLWATVHSMDDDQRRRFLSFVTGSDRSPIRGLGDIKMVVQRQGPDSESLPTASTCFNTLLIPDYKDEAKFRTKLLKAIEESEGFGLK